MQTSGAFGRHILKPDVPSLRPPTGTATRPKHCTFRPEYELRIVAEYGAVPRGEKAAVLRRERLYDSHFEE
ncbi:hypothetical protein GCM10020295_01670 [Streptomyces cinereospinus]